MPFWVRVEGVSTVVTEDVLRELFEVCGPVVDLQLDRAKAECLVSFGEEETAANTAVLMSGTPLGDREVKVSHVSGSPFAVPLPTSYQHHQPSESRDVATHNNNNNNNHNHHNRISTSSSSGANASNHAGSAAHPAYPYPPQPPGLPQQRPRPPPPPPPPQQPLSAQESEASHQDHQDRLSRTIYVGCLPQIVTEAMLESTFASCGRAMLVKLVRKPSAVTGLFFAFIEFESVRAVPDALALSGVVTIAGMPVQVNTSKTVISFGGGPNGPPQTADPTAVSASAAVAAPPPLSEAMRRVREAQERISKQAAERAQASQRRYRSHSRSGSRSRSRSRSPQRSRGRHRSRRSRSRHRSRSRSRSPARRYSRSGSPPRRRREVVPPPAYSPQRKHPKDSVWDGTKWVPK